MKPINVKEYIADCKNEDGAFNEQELTDLILWAYDQGWSEGIEDYKEEQNSADEHEFYRTR